MIKIPGAVHHHVFRDLAITMAPARSENAIPARLTVLKEKSERFDPLESGFAAGSKRKDRE
jgi:hypothetical protein